MGGCSTRSLAAEADDGSPSLSILLSGIACAPARLDQLWVGGIACLPLVGRSLCYLAMLVDRVSRALVGWPVEEPMDDELT